MKASTITPRSLDWLWWPYLPLGKISSVAGQMDQAKSLFTIWLASAVTNGKLDHSRGAGVVMLSAEDDPDDTIVPRLMAAGAHLDRIELQPIAAALDADHLSNLCDQLGDVRLITIDPYQAFVPPKRNAYVGQDQRQVLEPVRQLAGERSLSLTLIQHLNRNTDATDALARLNDSQAIPQLARSVMIWGPDPSDPDGDKGSMKALTLAKRNLARSKASATFAVQERQVADLKPQPVLVRGIDREIAPDDVVRDNETRTAVEEAVEWLHELLADGPVLAKDGQRKASEVGIAARTLTRAKRVAGVKSVQSRDAKGIDGWVWSPKSQDSPIDPLGHVGVVGHVGALGRSKDAKDAMNAKDAKVNIGSSNGQPPTTLLDVLGFEDAVVEAFKEAYDAEEIPPEEGGE